MAGVLGTSTVAQVAFIVRDIEATKVKFAEFLGVDAPPTVGGGNYEITKTEVYGQPAPNANALLAFFDAGPGLQIELIQPNTEKSVWREFLDRHGEGIHHIAFQVKGMDGKIKDMELAGYPLVQRGKYGDGGGEYAYFDAIDGLKCFVELLESYR
ncbi:MAG: VOC family protein [Clostridiales bacterium]|nr:VOC family protein [Clostridiales bacterium]MDR2751203.1 VOC family protein [Clostridiales bacterium]